MPPALCEQGFHTKGERTVLSVRGEKAEGIAIGSIQSVPADAGTFTRPERRIIEGARFLQRNFASSTKGLG